MTTLLDVQLARLLFPLLAEMAKGNASSTPQQFLHLAQTRYLDDRRVGQLIPLRVDRILAVIRVFTEANGLPDLTRTVLAHRQDLPSLIEHEQPSCFGFDWASVTTDFNLYGAAAERALTPKTWLGRETATRVMSEYFFEHREQYGQVMRYSREVLIDNLVGGMGVAEAFEVEARVFKSV